MNVYRKLAFVFFMLVGLSGAVTWRASASSWIPGDGSFQNPLNWSPNGVPGPGSVASFDSGGAQTVAFAADANTGYLFLSYVSQVMFDLSGRTYTLTGANVASSPGTPAYPYELSIGNSMPVMLTPQLTLTNGTLTGTSGILGAYVDGVMDGGGRLNVFGGATLNLADTLLVGEVANSSLSIANGGDVIMSPAGHLVVGFEDTVSSSVWVQGAGSTLNAGEHLHLGWFGDGEITVWSGGAFSADAAFLGQEIGSTGTANVHSGASWTTSEEMRVGDQGDGSITVSDAGTTLTNGKTNIAIRPFIPAIPFVSPAIPASTGVVTIELGATASLGETTVGSGGIGSLTIRSGAIVNSGFGNFVGDAMGSSGTVTVNGAGSSWTQFGFLHVGQGGTGTMNITGGGTVSTMGPNASIAALPGSTGSVAVMDAGSSWTIAGELGVGGSAFLLGPPGGTGSLTIGTGATVSVNGLGMFGGTTLYAAGTITLNGGTLTTPRINDGGGTLVFNTGTLTLTNSDFTIGGGSLLGAAVNLGPSMALNVSGTTTVDPGASLTISGGTFSTGALANNGAFALNSGTLAITGPGGLTIGNGGLFGSAYTLGAGRTLNVTNTTTVNGGAVLVVQSGGALSGGVLINNGSVVLDGAAAVVGNAVISNSGLIRGEGVVSGNVTNAAGGEIRAQAGKTLTLGGANGANLGKINLQGGTAEFSQALTNGANGQILGRGTLSVGGAGLTNNGQVALSSGITDVFGDVTNNTGSAAVGISISGNADVTFWDDVTNGAGSLFRVSSGSSATFFGTYGGAGITGSGNVYFEADVTPGFSPAAVAFGGDVNLGSNANLVIELGGSTPGSQHDQMNVAGLLTLGGTLDIRLINGFLPAAGQAFDILNSAGLAGAFDAVILPALGGSPAWNTSQLYTTGALSVGLPGDFNANGVVDGGDYVTWRRGLGTKYTQSDYTVWRSHFGESAGAGAGGIAYSVGGGNAAVPEPHSIVLFAFGMILAASRRNSQRRNSK